MWERWSRYNQPCTNEEDEEEVKDIDAEEEDEADEEVQEDGGDGNDDADDEEKNGGGEVREDAINHAIHNDRNKKDKPRVMKKQKITKRRRRKK